MEAYSTITRTLMHRAGIHSFSLMTLFAAACVGQEAVSLEYPVERYKGVHVVKNIPDGWDVGSYAPAAIDQGRPLMYIPRGSSPIDYKDGITIRNFWGVESGPEEFLRKVINGLDQQCIGYRLTPIKSFVENGFATASVLQLCGAYRATGKGDVSVLKAVVSKSSVVLLQRTIRRAPFDILDESATSGELMKLQKWLAGTMLCDTSRADRPCPPGR